MTSETTQQSPMVAQPQKEHLWLQKLVGEWIRRSVRGSHPEDAWRAEVVARRTMSWLVCELAPDISPTLARSESSRDFATSYSLR